LRVEEFPIRAHEVYSPPSGVHNGNAGYYLGGLRSSSVLLEI